VSGGELFEYISEKDHLTEEEAARFITQILEGVEHFHAKNIVHLDLKVSLLNFSSVFFIILFLLQQN
jgi:serine/threonine protein kinase